VKTDVADDLLDPTRMKSCKQTLPRIRKFEYHIFSGPFPRKDLVLVLLYCQFLLQDILLKNFMVKHHLKRGDAGR
jgi:hypothetical protein